jgi:hypothetical protein
MRHLVLLAQDDEGNLWGFWNDPGSGTREIIIIVGVLFLIGLAGFIWAAFWRKPRRRKHAYHHASSDDSNGGLPQRRKRKSGLARALGRSRRHRRHRRNERPINPTLAQVGGLPPPRRELPPGP